MKKITSFIFALILSCNCFAVPVNGEMPKKMQQFVDNLGTASASFKQTKILPESTKRFVSNGNVKFVKNVGFTWHQEKPSVNTFTSTLKTYCINGNTAQLNELPYFYQIQSMIDDMLNGDMADFLYAFNVDVNESGDNWTMVATPRLTAVADMVQDLTVYGTTRDLDKIIMTYNDGTIVILEFSRLKQELNYEIKC